MMHDSVDHANLLNRLLSRSEAASGMASTTEHPDEETIALFGDGVLNASDRNRIIDHLSNCSACRCLVALLWNDDNEDSVQASVSESASPTVQIIRSDVATESSGTTSNRLRSVVALASLAAVALFAVLVVRQGSDTSLVAESRTWRKAEQLLASADFGNARHVLENAERSGLRSARLLSLHLQAVRELPGSVALESAGSLTDFGYGLDGTLSRDVAAQDLLQQAVTLLNQSLSVSETSESLELILNRGHLRLSQNDFVAAKSDFQHATVIAKDNALSWLGLGLAEFGSGDFESAELEFRRSIERSPERPAARINLAMTLEELGRTADAIAAWEEVLQLQLTDNQREQIRHHVETLK